MNTEDFFQALYPNFNKNNNKINVRLINQDKSIKPISKFFTTIEGLTNYCIDMDKSKDLQVFFTCPELNHSANSAKEDNITRYQFLYSDIDPDVKDKDGQVIKRYAKSELMERIKAFPLSPSLIVESGNGYHLYWLLKMPLYQIQQVKFLLSKIQERINGDKVAILATQLLRPPLTHNKKKDWLEVKVIDNNSKRYNLLEICNALDISDDELEDAQNYKKEVKKTTKSGKVKIYEKGLRFDFTKKISPLGIALDDYYQLLDTIKRQNILLASNLPTEFVGQSFNCCFHDDKNPSANVYLHKDGYYYYKCFGCDETMDIISLYEKVTNEDFASALVNLAEFFGIKCEYSEWIQEQINKYHYNRVDLHKFDCEDNIIKYPNLYKLLKRRTVYLSLMNDFGAANIKSEKYTYENENLFFLSYSYFANYYSSQGLAVTERTARRNFNLFCALGLIKKVPIEKLEGQVKISALEQVEKITKRLNTISAKEHKVEQVQAPNFYIIYKLKDRLSLAEERAKVLLKNKFKASTVNKEFLIMTLGREIAEEVYPDERTVSKKNSTIGQALEETLIDLINRQGYATKKQVINTTKLKRSYGATRAKKSLELDKYLGQMLLNNNLEFIRYNRKLGEIFNLKDKSSLIVPKGIK